MMKKLSIIVIAIALLVSLVPVNAVLADDGTGGIGFGMRPRDVTKGYFVFENVQAGAVIEDAMYVINNTDEPMVLNIRPVSGHTAMTGGVAFPADGLENGYSSWIDLPGSGEMTVSPKEPILMPFKVTVPEGTAPGEYVIGFLATPVESATIETTPNAQGGGFAVKIVPQMGLTVIVHVADPNNCAIEITGVERTSNSGQWLVNVDMNNIGNVHFKGNGVFTVTNKADSSQTLVKNMPMGYWVMGDTVQYPLVFSSVPEAGSYHLEVTMTSSENPECTATYVEDFDISKSEKDTADMEATRQALAEANSNGGVATDPNAIQIKDLMQYGSYCFIGLAVLFLIIIILLFLRDKKKKEEKERRRRERASRQGGRY